MNHLLIFLSLIPLVGLNIWHSVLLMMPYRAKRPGSISEHATETRRLLTSHRVMHISGSVLLWVFSFGYLLPHHATIAAGLLIIGGVFDVLEVLTLNKKTAATTIRLNPHTITAWSMALSYLLYASVIVVVVGMSAWLSLAVWVSFLILLAVSALGKFKHFWLTQHIYFCCLALVIMVAHLRLMQ